MDLVLFVFFLTSYTAGVIFALKMLKEEVDVPLLVFFSLFLGVGYCTISLLVSALPLLI
jgi:hypothetical protein